MQTNLLPHTSPEITARVDFHVIPASRGSQKLSLIYCNTSAVNALQQPKHQAKAATVNPRISTLKCAVQHQCNWRRKFPGSESKLCIQILLQSLQVSGINLPTHTPSDMLITIWKSLRECQPSCPSQPPYCF